MFCELLLTKYLLLLPCLQESSASLTKEEINPLHEMADSHKDLTISHSKLLPY